MHACKTHTYTHPHITKPTHTHTHTHTHPHITKPTLTHTHPHITKPTHTHTPTHYKTHAHIHTPTHYKTTGENRGSHYAVSILSEILIRRLPNKNLHRQSYTRSFQTHNFSHNHMSSTSLYSCHIMCVPIQFLQHTVQYSTNLTSQQFCHQVGAELRLMGEPNSL